MSYSQNTLVLVRLQGTSAAMRVALSAPVNSAVQRCALILMASRNYACGIDPQEVKSLARFANVKPSVADKAIRDLLETGMIEIDDDGRFFMVGGA